MIADVRSSLKWRAALRLMRLGKRGSTGYGLPSCGVALEHPPQLQRGRQGRLPRAADLHRAPREELRGLFEPPNNIRPAEERLKGGHRATGRPRNYRHLRRNNTTSRVLTPSALKV